jgi:hypothetical protein
MVPALRTAHSDATRTQTRVSSVALDLIVRQGAFLALLALLGSGPAALLSRRFDLATRVALAPALGLAFGICLTTALIGLAPVASTWWVVVVAAVGSLALAAWQLRRGRVELARFGPREIAQLLVVLVVAAGPIDYTLHQHYSVGPSVYAVRDVLGYTAEVDGEQHLSLPQAAALSGRPLANLEDQFWANYAAGFQNMDASALEASTNDLLGLYGTDTIASYMLVLILVGALGAFAAVRYALASRSWVAALAGALFGGPFYMQLYFDGSQAAICGTALVLPFAVVGWDAIRGGGRLVELAILGLIAAALLAAYPLVVPEIAGAAGLVLLWLAARAHRQKRLREALRAAVPRLALVLALAAGLATVAFARDLRYWQAIINHTVGLPVLGYQFPVPILPPWLLQTGEFANLPNFVTDASFDSILRGAVLPALLLAIIGYGLWRRRIGLALAGLVVIAAGLAEYALRSQGCEYCVDRNLLPVEPAAIVLIALGVAALAASARAWRWAVAVAATLLVAVPTALATRSAHERYTNYDYFLDNAVRTLVAGLPRHPGPIELEGFNEDISGPAEYGMVYDLLAERGFTVSAPIEADDYASDAYLSASRPPGPEFHPEYRYVLTRLSSVATDRTIVARSGGFALERRTAPLDVTPYSGLGLPLPRLDRGGLAWAQPDLTPFRMYVVGGHGRAPVWVRVTLQSDVALGLTAGISWRAHNGSIVACVPTTGAAPIRRAVLYMSGTLGAPPPIYVSIALPLPIEDIQLTGMRVVTGHCRL